MSVEPHSTLAGGTLPEPVRRLLTDLRARCAAAAAAPIPLPAGPHAVCRAVAPDDDLVTRFTTAAQSAGAQVHATTRSAAPALVRDLLNACNAQQVVLECDADSACDEHLATALGAALRQAGIVVTTERDDATLFSASASITGAWAAIAETGTIVCHSGSVTARGTSLIVPLHVALLAASQIVADLFDAFERLGRRAALPANVNFITGPSKTADIEGVLITGVHGPGAVHLVVLTDA